MNREREINRVNSGIMDGSKINAITGELLCMEKYRFANMAPGLMREIVLDTVKIMQNLEKETAQ